MSSDSSGHYCIDTPGSPLHLWWGLFSFLYVQVVGTSMALGGPCRAHCHFGASSTPAFPPLLVCMFSLLYFPVFPLCRFQPTSPPKMPCLCYSRFWLSCVDLVVGTCRLYPTVPCTPPLVYTHVVVRHSAGLRCHCTCMSDSPCLSQRTRCCVCCCYPFGLLSSLPYAFFSLPFKLFRCCSSWRRRPPAWRPDPLPLLASPSLSLSISLSLYLFPLPGTVVNGFCCLSRHSFTLLQPTLYLSLHGFARPCASFVVGTMRVVWVCGKLPPPCVF